ncbi:MAG: ATP-dependent DNA helicase RecG [Thermotogota bacterium]|nr:ATP-dependent DNA helicase RecG [Thermotogota bacterium]
MIFEDFIDNCENLFQSYEEGNIKPAEITGEIKRYASVLDKEELKGFNELHKYLRSFLEYLIVIPKLPAQRQKVRIENGKRMIDKLRKQFLLKAKGELLRLKSGNLSLESKVKFAKNVGERRSKILNKMGIYTIEDLLWWLPRDYEDRRKIIPLSSITPEKKCTVQVTLLNYSKKKVKGYSIITAVVTDGFGQILLKWFNQDYILGQLKKESEYIVTGTAKKNAFGPYEMNSPEIEEISGTSPREIVPVYSTTSGISQKMMRRILKNNLGATQLFQDTLSRKLRDEKNLLDVVHAMQGIHYPKSVYEIRKSRERLVFEEFYLFEIALLFNREKLRFDRGGIKKKIEGKLVSSFCESLDFVLTNDQKKAFEEIRADLTSEKPMNRLLQGDVGSGKTVVAEMAIIDNFEAGFQSAFMIPTSVLATQHYERLVNELENFGINVELLVGSMKKSDQDRIKRQLATGDIDVIVGTHALIQENVEFKELGLVIIDEQHRFGVEQRKALMNKGNLIDTLVMTATPIPRTLSLTAYGDLDVSVIREMPPGRKPVKTMLIIDSKLNDVHSFVREEVNKGNQVFFIYPLIEESEVIDLKAATEEAEKLKNEIFPEIPLELLHGRMTEEQKKKIMAKFKKKEIKILVSTSVIEVGIDMPSATLMVIEHPERFGLAQLHQLRGRVGRSSITSYCFLIINRNLSDETVERLRQFAFTNDGFKVAELDLTLRGPGEFMGIRQHGMPEFKIGDIVKDAEILYSARYEAEKTITEDPKLEKDISLKKAVKERFGERISLIEVS